MEISLYIISFFIVTSNFYSFIYRLLGINIKNYV
jgi:hypothetical protein